MNHTKSIPYTPSEHEAESASNSYVMSLVALIAGVPLPIINLIATLIFFLGNRKASHFVRWHCTQALLSQLSVFFINSFGFWWTISIVFTEEEINSAYIAYILILVSLNIAELVSTIYAAIQTRKGHHVSMWVYGPLTQLICKS